MDIKIKRVHMLEVIEKLPKSLYRCLCDCGNEKILRVGHFNTGKMKSCGCHWKTGMTGSRELISYSNMMARCHNKNNKRYKDYGAKGIFVCEEWRNNFKQFIADMGKCPDGYQIDRIDNTKGYYKENCRWVSPKENMLNRSISRNWYLYGNKFTCLKDASKFFGVSTCSISAWCLGRYVAGKYYPPKNDCYAEYIYPAQKLTSGVPVPNVGKSL